MGVIDWICVAFGVLGFAYGFRCYTELWRWARQMQNARIAVAYKKRVGLQAPLLEWMLWTNQLDKDKDSNGRVVFSRAGVSVAITKAVIAPGPIRERLRAIRSTRAHKGSGAPTVREGTWNSQDQTPANGKAKA